MCRFKSGVILKTRNVLSPKGNESHSDLLESLNIPDDYEHSMKMFVRAELIPPNGNIAAEIQDWKFNVDQDIVPDWFSIDKEKYEKSFRQDVEAWVKENLGFVLICGYAWTPITDGEYTYYFMNGCMKQMTFGGTNNYSTSEIRNYLKNSDLYSKLQDKFGKDLCPIKLDLTSLDGCKDYGIVEEDILAIPTIEMLMKYGDKIPLIDIPYWLATPNQTPSRNDASCVQCVDSNGCVVYDGCGWGDVGVRPFFILKSNISVS